MTLKDRIQSSALATQAQEAWGGMPRPRRIVTAGGAVVLVGLLVWAMVASSEVEYRPFADELDTQEAAAVRDVLEKKGIPYRFDDNGTILVPREQFHRAKLDVSEAGLPAGGVVGYELLDEQGPIVDRDTRELNRQRALEGELARTIRALDEVKAARVHLSIPKKSVFKEDQSEATASVVVKTRPGHTLELRQIEGLRLLVSSAVDGMRPGSVTIVDSTGKAVGPPKEADGFGMPTTQLEIKRVFERSLEKRIVGMLEPIAGYGHVIVRTSVDLDFSSSRSTIEELDTENPAVTSEHRTTETRNRSKPRATGRVSAGAAAAGAAGAGATASERSQRQDEFVNYAHNKTTRHEVNPPGRVRRLTVSVMLAGRPQSAKNEEDGETAPPLANIPFSDEELAEFSKAIKGAIGFDASRGDRVEISNMEFSGLQEDLMIQEPLLPPDVMKRVLDWGFVLLLLVALYLTVARPLLRSARAQAGEKKDGKEEESEGEDKSLPADVAAKLLGGVTPAGDSDGEAGSAGGQPALAITTGENADDDGIPALDVPAKLAVKLRARAIELTQADEKRAAHVIRAWLQVEEEQHADG